ncbi:MAG TPA: hypothetical protein VII75_16945 [Thermoanaerobaculia bacterium]|nr:hypothetical protein [Thermoanaerobaculia bacterium]
MNSALPVLKSAGLIVLAWLIAYAAVKLGVHGVGISLLQVTACVICSAIAVRFHATFAIIALSIMGIAIAVEAAIHTTYGFDKVQGFPSHLALMLSVALGLVVGRFVLTARSAATA